MSYDYNPKNPPRMYTCHLCGATYTHDEANAHAVYFCLKKESRHDPKPRQAASAPMPL